MENIILKQHSPIVILRNPEENQKKEVPKEEPDSFGWGWIVAGIIVLIVLVFVAISYLKKER